MLVLYTAPTHNGLRAQIALAESGLEYTTRKLDLSQAEQRKHDYLDINPAGRIPALVDTNGPEGEIRLSQSGAILIYVAGKATHLWPSSPVDKIAALQWLMFACTDVAPGATMVWHTKLMMPEKSAANVEYCEHRLLRWFGEAEAQLTQSEYLAGEISIADHALFPVVHMYQPLIAQAGFRQLPRWYAALYVRPGVRRGLGEPE